MPAMRFAAPAGLLLLIVVVFWKLILPGEYVWFDHPDMVYIEIPRLQFQAREFHQGHFPLWDPSIWIGQSLIGQTQPGPLFPLNILFLLLPLDSDGYLQFKLLNAYWIVLHALAALACYALCRDWNRSHAAAILAAIGFGCGGFLGTVAWLDVAAGGTFTPLVVLFLSRAAQGRKPWRNAALSGLFLGLAWLSGHHEIPLLVSLAAGLIWLITIWYRRTAWGPALASLTIAALIAAVQLLPTIEFGRLSKRWAGTPDPVGWHDTIPYTIATIYSLPARGILNTFLPSTDRYADCAPFLGLAIVTMALFGLTAIRDDHRVRWTAIATLAALAFALGAATPIHGPLYALLPGLNKARMPVRAIHLFNLGLCILAAYGLDALRAGLRPRIASRALILLGIVILSWAIGSAGLDDRLILTGFLAFVLAATLRVNIRPTAIWIAVATIEIYGVSTATFNSRHREDQFKFARLLESDKDIAAYLHHLDRQSPIRLDVKETDAPLNFGDYHGVDMLGGYMAGVPENILRSEVHTERSKTILGVTHYLAKEPDREGQTELFKGASGLKVFSNPETRPRAWSVHEAIQVHSQAEMRDRLQVQPLEIHRQTLLQNEAPKLETCTGDEVKILSRSPNRIRIKATMRCTGMVILGDAYYPGWEAKVDNQPTKVWEAYGVVRGVVVPQGPHEIDFRFKPPTVYLGGVCFLLGLLLTALLSFLPQKSLPPGPPGEATTKGGPQIHHET